MEQQAAKYVPTDGGRNGTDRLTEYGSPQPRHPNRCTHQRSSLTLPRQHSLLLLDQPHPWERVQRKLARGRDAISKKLGCPYSLRGLSVQPRKLCSEMTEEPLMGSFGDHRDVVMSKIDFPRPLPVVEKQHETAHLNVVSLALPVTAFQSCQEEDALIVD